jgi:hypothetical protein
VRTVHIALSAAIGWAVVVAWLALAVSAWAASPSPSTGVGGDPRSSGQGPGLVGDPLFALVAVIAIGLGALILTLAYVRLTRRRFD